MLCPDRLRGKASIGKLVRLRLFQDRKSTRLNSSHLVISYAVFCLKKKTTDAHSHPECQSPSCCSAMSPSHSNFPLMPSTKTVMTLTSSFCGEFPCHAQ